MTAAEEQVVTGRSEAWAAANPRSGSLSQRARRVLPGGVTHDVRRAAPFPLAVARAEGARKWDLDGHEIICYVMGHGALLLGHCAPEVVAAVQHQAALAFHPGACHELECEWAELVTDLVPSAELVRFTSSGTEATLLALRLARAATGRERVVKLAGHFHGWHDQVLVRHRRAVPRAGHGRGSRRARAGGHRGPGGRGGGGGRAGRAGCRGRHPRAVRCGVGHRAAPGRAARRAARADRRHRDGAGLRRGGLRVPLVARGRAGRGGGDARPHRAREDPGRGDARRRRGRAG